MNQKGFANIILIVLVIILIGVVGYLTLIKKSTTQPTPSDQTQVQNNTSSQPATNNEVSNPPVSKKTFSLPSDAEKIGETDKFIIYKRSEWVGQVKNYKIFKLDSQGETELKLLNYSFDVNAEFYLSPDGKYIARTLWSVQPAKIELLSLDNIEKLTTLVTENEQVLIKMIWADDSSKIAYWTVNRGSASYPPFKIYLADLRKTPPTISLIKTYTDMTMQGDIQFENLISAERKLNLKRAKITDGAPAKWIEGVINF